MNTRLDVRQPQTAAAYRRVFGNRAWVLLWSGEAISTIGDAFFNLAVMWVIYAQSKSILQTALIQVVWHLSSVLFGPLAGVWADLWDRKRIMILTNLLSALVVAGLSALIVAQGHVSPWGVFLTIFLLNSLSSLFAPAVFALLPEIVGKDLLTTSTGLFTMAAQVATLIGSALAGGIIPGLGVVWALSLDALSFVLAAGSTAAAVLPQKPARADSKPSVSSWQAMREGLRVIKGQPTIQTLIWLIMCINVASFMGPLLPALVHSRLQGGAAVYGLLGAVGIVGSMLGGVLAGGLERHINVGRLLIAGWSLAGLSILGVAASTSLVLTSLLEISMAFGLALGNIAITVILQARIPDEFRGRVFALTSGMSVIAIPISALLGGWLADIFGPAPLFAVAGAWILGTAILAWTNRSIRTTCL